MTNVHRRNFLKASSLTVIPALLPFSTLFAKTQKNQLLGGDKPTTNFFGDGEMFDAYAYIGKLQEINAATPIKPDRYGVGGSVEELEKEFALITGKEKAYVYAYWYNGKSTGYKSIKRRSCKSICTGNQPCIS